MTDVSSLTDSELLREWGERLPVEVDADGTVVETDASERLSAIETELFERGWFPTDDGWWEKKRGP